MAEGAMRALTPQESAKRILTLMDRRRDGACDEEEVEWDSLDAAPKVPLNRAQRAAARSRMKSPLPARPRPPVQVTRRFHWLACDLPRRPQTSLSDVAPAWSAAATPRAPATARSRPYSRPQTALGRADSPSDAMWSPHARSPSPGSGAETCVFQTPYYPIRTPEHPEPAEGWAAAAARQGAAGSEKVLSTDGATPPSVETEQEEAAPAGYWSPAGQGAEYERVVYTTPRAARRKGKVPSAFAPAPPRTRHGKRERAAGRSATPRPPGGARTARPQPRRQTSVAVLPQKQRSRIVEAVRQGQARRREACLALEAVSQRRLLERYFCKLEVWLTLLARRRRRAAAEELQTCVARAFQRTQGLQLMYETVLEGYGQRSKRPYPVNLAALLEHSLGIAPRPADPVATPPWFVTPPTAPLLAKRKVPPRDTGRRRGKTPRGAHKKEAHAKARAAQAAAVRQSTDLFRARVHRWVHQSREVDRSRPASAASMRTATPAPPFPPKEFRPPPTEGPTEFRQSRRSQLDASGVSEASHTSGDSGLMFCSDPAVREFCSAPRSFVWAQRLKRSLHDTYIRKDLCRMARVAERALVRVYYTVWAAGAARVVWQKHRFVLKVGRVAAAAAAALVRRCYHRWHAHATAQRQELRARVSHMVHTACPLAWLVSLAPRDPRSTPFVHLRAAAQSSLEGFLRQQAVVRETKPSPPTTAAPPLVEMTSEAAALQGAEPPGGGADALSWMLRSAPPSAATPFLRALCESASQGAVQGAPVGAEQLVVWLASLGSAWRCQSLAVLADVAAGGQERRPSTAASLQYLSSAPPASAEELLGSESSKCPLAVSSNSLSSLGPSLTQFAKTEVARLSAARVDPLAWLAAHPACENTPMLRCCARTRSASTVPSSNSRTSCCSGHAAVWADRPAAVTDGMWTVFEILLAAAGGMQDEDEATLANGAAPLQHADAEACGGGSAVGARPDAGPHEEALQEITAPRRERGSEDAAAPPMRILSPGNASTAEHPPASDLSSMSDWHTGSPADIAFTHSHPRVLGVDPGTPGLSTSCRLCRSPLPCTGSAEEESEMNATGLLAEDIFGRSKRSRRGHGLGLCERCRSAERHDRKEPKAHPLARSNVSRISSQSRPAGPPTPTPTTPTNDKDNDTLDCLSTASWTVSEISIAPSLAGSRP
eukprot:TRINITY_DN18125_c0_g1_i1.p1 TRINITY_DN18125_c0_g1~~TRINITY_DN18125_c0_g1_i1.p1  ORF type:complete len:1171 (+),score=195.12 TRINITY_DN18125_c0_g1_i1:88-3600(+)